MKKTSSIRKRNLIVGISLSVVAILAAIGFFMFLPKDTIEAKEQVEVPYGEAIRLEPALFLESDAEGVTIESPLLSDSSKYTYDTTTKKVTTKGKDALEPGTYAVTLVRGDQKVSSKLVVKDVDSAGKPRFIGFPELVVVEQDAIDFDLANYFLAIANDPVRIETDAVDITKPGENTIKVKAICENGKILEQEVNVKVVSAKDVANGETLSSMVDGLVPLSQQTWDALNSGTQTSISIAPQPKEIETILLQKEKGTLKNAISYTKPDGKKYFDPETFKPEGAPAETKTEAEPKAAEPETNTSNQTPAYQEPSYYNPGTYYPPTDPGTSDPGNSGTTDPGTSDPGNSGTTDPGTSDPGNSGTTDPGTSDPGNSGTTDPGNSGSTEPTPVDPITPPESGGDSQ